MKLFVTVNCMVNCVYTMTACVQLPCTHAQACGKSTTTRERLGYTCSYVACIQLYARLLVVMLSLLLQLLSAVAPAARSLSFKVTESSAAHPITAMVFEVTAVKGAPAGADWLLLETVDGPHFSGLPAWFPLDTHSESTTIKWWSEYFQRSNISIPDKKLEAYYKWQLYKVAAATRKGKLPIDLMGPWFRATNWPKIWANLNVQLTYLPMAVANQADIGDLTFVINGFEYTLPNDDWVEKTFDVESFQSNNA